ncbi:amidohydrolase family protein [Novosphingobium sp. BL-52-GroH]|uniref:amidohydrolase family protein n=1 Tax=Novosphingobium sp. BL-52-GroH TaxID=3349877 RepID=UPI00384B7FD7
MLIDLHAHAVHPDFYDQDPFWGPQFAVKNNGDFSLKVGHWILTLGQPERRAAVEAGTALSLEEHWKMVRDSRNRLKSMDAAGQDAQVLSIPSHCYMYWTPADFSTRFAKRCNEVLGTYCADSDNRLFYWAHAPLNVPEACPEIIRHAVKEYGAVGLSAGGANFGGLEFDSPELDTVWETMCDLDLPIFVHGYNQSVTWGEKANDDRYETTAIVGMNYDETQCFWNLICGGVLDRFPDLKVYITHAGGFVPYQLGRLDECNKNLEVRHNKHDLMHYMKNFWFDPEIHALPMRQAMCELIGADQLVYGTNFGGSDAIRFDMTADLRMSDEDKDKIRYLNALKLFHKEESDIGRCSSPAVDAMAVPL